MHHVAITGVGIISCLGLEPETVGAALAAGQSGIVVDDERRRRGFRSPLTAAIRGFNARDWLGRKQRKTMTEYSIQAWAATQQALEMAGLQPDDWQNEQTGLIFGNDSSCLAAIEQVDSVREHEATGSIGSGCIFRSMTSNITMNLNALLGTRGISMCISSACSSGGHGIGLGLDLIRHGRQQRVICGGAQEINWESMCSFDALDAFSTRTDEPARACRPFDRDRDGLVPGGGAAVVVLERLDEARARGATVLGRVAGYGFSADGAALAVPTRTGIAQAMRAALADAAAEPDAVDYVCAHATSTPNGDAAEAANIEAVFGAGTTPPVSSLKSMTGHELWMAGAAQVVYTVIMRQQGFTAANINFDAPDEATAGLNIITETRAEPPSLALCNSAGFGGTNAALVLAFD